MEANQQLFDKIESYLTGQMAPDQAVIFEREMEQDPELKAMVQQQKFELDSMEFLLEKDLKERMEEWDAAPPKDKSSGFNRMWLLLLLIPVLLIFLPRGKDTPAPEAPANTSRDELNLENPAPTIQDQPVIQQTDSLTRPIQDQDIPEENKEKGEPSVPQNPRPRLVAIVNDFYELPGTFTATLRDIPTDTSSSTPFSMAVQAVQDEKYDAAINYFQQIDADADPALFETAREWLAHLYLKAGNYAQAAPIFEAYVTQNFPETVQKDEWYWLLSLIPNYNANRVQVDALLQKILDPETRHAYATQARELKSRLDNAID